MSNPVPAEPSDNSTLRRAVAAFAAFSAPLLVGLLKSKLGIDVPTEQVIAVELALVTYVGQSVVNSIHARSVAAAQKIAATPAAAVVDLQLGPRP